MEKLKSISEFKLAQKNISEAKKQDTKVKVMVHMGTCCIAAGSKEILDVMKSEVSSLSLENEIEVIPGGCIGYCYAEPTVCVQHPNGEFEVYGNIDSQQGRIIVNRCRTQSPITGVNEIKPQWEIIETLKGE